MSEGRVSVAALTEPGRDEIKAIVCDILELDPEVLTDTSLLKEDHDADSLRAIEILAALERSFDLVIAQSELSRMVNLEGIYAVVEESPSQ